MTCTNLNTGTRAILILKAKGWTSKGDYEAEGKIVDSKGNIESCSYKQGIYSVSTFNTNP